MKIINYYERKKIGIDMINSMIDKGHFTTKDITYAVLMNTQLSDRFVNSYIDLELERGSIIISDNVIRRKVA